VEWKDVGVWRCIKYLLRRLKFALLIKRFKNPGE